MRGLLEKETIIHNSGWAITIKRKGIVKKIYKHNNYSKIKKEVDLLCLNLQENVKLYFDKSYGLWVSEIRFIQLYSIINNDFANILLKLKDILNKWQHERYLKLVCDEWMSLVVPWYCLLLDQYIEFSSRYKEYLLDLKPTHFIHGDFTLNNVYIDENDDVIVLDFENAMLGPLYWDEMTLVYSLLENELYKYANVAMNEFTCDWEMLETIAVIRLAQSRRKKNNVEIREKVYTYIVNKRRENCV